MKGLSISLFMFILFALNPLLSEEDHPQQNVSIDLIEPVYSEGTLTTDQGGIITGPDLRIQARHITYRRLKDQSTVEAEGDLIVEFGEYIFVGKKLIYDFEKKEGVIFEGKTEVEPWFFGGDKLELRPDGSYLIYDAYVTTSQKQIPEWALYSKSMLIEKQHLLSAKNVDLKINRYSVLWIPSLKANLHSILDSPIRYRFRWGGKQGPRLGLTYEIFSWEHWKTFVRFDYRLTRGPGGGIETYYKSADHKTEFQSINYLAKDSSLLKPHEKARYEFQGLFRKQMNEDKTLLLFSYDKISDQDMPSNYNEWDFYFEKSERTQLLIKHQEEEWISSFYARVRVNSFETVKEEIPSFRMNYKPFELSQSGIIFQNKASASYLDFKYSKHLHHVSNYNSTRFQYFPTLYRPFSAGPFTITPEIGAVNIFYGNSPDRNKQWLGQGILGVSVTSQLHRYYDSLKHVIIPYSSFHYYSNPTTPANKHYIFDITDGWTQLNKLTLGLKNILFLKRNETCISRLFSFDIYSHLFIDTPHVHTLPKIYGKLTFAPLPSFKNSVSTAWDFVHHKLDHFNFLCEWSLHPDFAVSAEYRYRDAYNWRKVDEENFFVDAYHSINSLYHSSVSDRRDTFLFHFFYRFYPNWSFEFSSRQGWHRKKEPSYKEYEIDLITTIQSAWNLKLSYQHLQDDDRIALYLNVGIKRPDEKKCSLAPICYE